jgi:hypothetical protein
MLGVRRAHPEDPRDDSSTVPVVLEYVADVGDRPRRGPFICQSQSMNVFMEEPTTGKLTPPGWREHG